MFYAIPATTLVVAGIVAVWVYHYDPLSLTERIFETISGRRTVAFAAFVLAFVFGIACRLPKWQGVLNGKADSIDCGLLTAIAAMAVLAILASMTQLRQNDTSEARVKELKDTNTALKEIADVAKKQEFFYRWVAQSFLRAVGTKADSLHRTIGEVSIRADSKHPTVRDLKRAVDPNRQIATLIQILYSIYEQLLHHVNDRAKLRVVYFRVEKNELKVQLAWNGTTDQFVKSLPRKAKDKFSLKNGPQCAASWCAINGDIMIIPDAEKADQDPLHPFEFSFSFQKNYLRSALVIPIKESAIDSHCRHVICVDTDCTGFFNESHREEHEFIKRQFEQRLLVEIGMEKLLASPPSTKGTQE